MIPLRLRHDNCVGGATRLLMGQLAIRLSPQAGKSLVIAVLEHCLVVARLPPCSRLAGKPESK
jgi:hypothetical protein